PEYGCIVVKEDGELYEFRMGMDFSAGDDLVAVRNEETRPIALHPRDYIVYAYNGLVALTELLLEQEEAGQQTSP
ncbi:MAG TPA: hypothetical protein VNL92_03380, partial [Dehalococcoidia bacterium]|nr:hypothetical protein [Dehalococcoidia bacterium]